jgi:MFS family permease
MPYKPLTKEQRGQLGAWYRSIIAPEAILPACVIMFFSLAGIMYTSYMEPFATSEGIANISWYFTVYALVILAARPMFGRLTDKLGSLKVVLPGLAVFAASFVVVSTAHSLTQILIGAVLAAAGFGAAQPAIQTMAMKSVPAERRGAASNTNYFGIDLGYWLGPTIGGVVISTAGYRPLFLLTLIPIALGAAILIIGAKPYSRRLARRNGEH